MREEKTEEEEELEGGCGLTCHTREASRPLLIPASLSLSLSSRSLLPTIAWRAGGRVGEAERSMEGGRQRGRVGNDEKCMHVYVYARERGVIIHYNKHKLHVLTYSSGAAKIVSI